MIAGFLNRCFSCHKVYTKILSKDRDNGWASGGYLSNQYFLVLPAQTRRAKHIDVPCAAQSSLAWQVLCMV